MQSGSKNDNDNADVKKKYIFFSDPDEVAKRAEKAAVEQAHSHFTEEHENKQDKFPLKFDLKNLLNFHPVQPYPFSFVTAIKHKLSAGEISQPLEKSIAVKSNKITQSDAPECNSNWITGQGSYATAQEESIQSLKIPDLKIISKGIDCSSRDTTNLKNMASIKFDNSAKDLSQSKNEKGMKGYEKVQRKLDFNMPEGHSSNSECIEPLKVPNVSVVSNLSKKKEHWREYFKEKENRSKRLKKDDVTSPKLDDTQMDILRRSRGLKHSTKKDTSDGVNNVLLGKSKHEYVSANTVCDNDSFGTKTKVKNFATSTAKKEISKRHRSPNTVLRIPKDTLLESKSIIFTAESLSDNSEKISDKSMRDDLKSHLDHLELKHKEDDSQKWGQLDSQRYDMSRVQGQFCKDQNKRQLDKLNKIEMLQSELSEEINSSSNSIPQFAKPKEYGNSSHNSRTQFSKTDESSDSRLKEISRSQTPKTSSSSSDLNDNSFPKQLLDPRRISFRDSHENQEEFHNLVTPDMNLILRSKRKKPVLLKVDSEFDPSKLKSKQGCSTDDKNDQKNVQLMNPAALHMQFQAELHLLDSFNESLRQVMDIEKCLYNSSQCIDGNQVKEQNQITSELKSHSTDVLSKDGVDNITDKAILFANKSDSANAISDGLQSIAKDDRVTNELYVHNHDKLSSAASHDLHNSFKKGVKSVIKVVEVQTQTVNDIATQTDLNTSEHNISKRLYKISGIANGQNSIQENEISQITLNSVSQSEDLDHVEDMSFPNKMRTMSEISLHETTSSIKTETGTEISISTRDLTCSFNKYLDLELAKLIKDEKLRYDKIEMLFKSREKTLNDRTKKLVKLEEQKRALRDTGQDSRISSVKKKQRALLLKLQQEKDEMNRLKELHEIASQERKLMLQKQRNMFNPQMSTKNILTKLKRSADNQSPRRLCGPMKGYDIRSNSSMSSLIDSDKSQQDRSQMDANLQAFENDVHFQKLDYFNIDKFTSFVEESNTSMSKYDKSNEAVETAIRKKYSSDLQNENRKYELKSRKYDEKMPKGELIRLKSNQLDLETKLVQGHSKNMSTHTHIQKQDLPLDSSKVLKDSSDKYNSESTDYRVKKPKDKQSSSKCTTDCIDIIQQQTHFIRQDSMSTTSKSSQISEEIFQSISGNIKSPNRATTSEITKKLHTNSDSKINSKRKSIKYQKARSSYLTNSQITEDIIKQHNKLTKIEKDQFHKINDEKNFHNIDFDDSQNSLYALVRHSNAVQQRNAKLFDNILGESDLPQNISERDCKHQMQRGGGDSIHNDNHLLESQINDYENFRQTTEENEKRNSRSIVIRQENTDSKTSKLEEILSARQAALTSRKNCVKEWMEWHAKLKAEENHVAQMEQAALRLINATSNVLSFHDTTVSSDTSDVEGRIELLTEKLRERRIEISRLRREGKRQAKQKLRALEANLLEQIKKYDLTIDEMRKKLELQKDLKDSEKLAIEVKSIAEIKVPEIPIKKLQDIYKKSELSRSRSESDLSRPTDHQSNISKNTHSVISTDSYERNMLQHATVLSDNDTTSNIPTSGFIPKDVTSNVSNISENIIEQMEADKMKVNNVDSSSCVSKRNGSTRHSSIEKEINTVSTSNTPNDDLSIIQSEKIESREELSESSAQMSSKSHFSQVSLKDVSENVNNADLCTVKTDENIQISNTTIKTDTDEGFQVFSKKLDFLQLNNKNLNADITSLENEIKMLSEMMSRLGTKTDEKSKVSSNNDKEIITVENDERSTSKDISENLLRSDPTDNNSADGIIISDFNKESEDVETGDESIIQKQDDADPNSYSVSTNENSDIISTLIPENISESKPIQEVDYEKRSKAILNEIERSIMSEHITTAESSFNSSDVALGKSIKNLHKDTAELSHDLISLENDFKSISEIIFKVSENKKNLSSAVKSVTERAANVKLAIENNKFEKNDVENINPDMTSILQKETVVEKMSDNLRSQNIILAETMSAAVNEEYDSNNIYSMDIENSEKNQNKFLVSKPENDESDSMIISQYNKDENSQSKLLDNSRNDNIVLKQDILYLNIDKNDENIIDAIRPFNQTLNNSNANDSSLMKVFNDERSNDQSTFSTEHEEHEVSEIIYTENIDEDNWTVSDSFEAKFEDEDVLKSQSEVLQDDKSYQTNSDKSCSSQKNTYIDGEFDEINDSRNLQVSILAPSGESTNIDIYNMQNDEFEIPDNNYIEQVLNKDSNELTTEDNGDQDTNFKISVGQLLSQIKLDEAEKNEEINLIDEANDTEKYRVHQLNTSKLVEETKNEQYTQGKIIEDIVAGHVATVDPSLIASILVYKNIESDKATNLDTLVDTATKSNDISHESAMEVENRKEGDGKIQVSEDVIVVVPDQLDQTTPEDLKVIRQEKEFSFLIENTDNQIFDDMCNNSNLEASSHVKKLEQLINSISNEVNSDNGQLDNLIEVIESSNHTVECREKIIEMDNEELTRKSEITNEENDGAANKLSNTQVDTEFTEKIVVLVKDPEYEDISEESLEVSEILDKNTSKEGASQKSDAISKAYQLSQKSDEVLRILDQISRKQNSTDAELVLNVKIDELELQNKKDDENSMDSEEQVTDNDSSKIAEICEKSVDHTCSEEEKAEKNEMQNAENDIESPKKNTTPVTFGSDEEILPTQDQNTADSTSDGCDDTPRAVSEIEMDSPRNLDDSKLDVDTLDDDLLAVNNRNADTTSVQVDTKTDFHSVPIAAMSEKELQAVIDKLEATMKQPGSEDKPSLESKLLLEQLQIALKIKKLEGLELSYYIREIPNKPPPPYTPPGGSRHSTSFTLLTPPPAVIPSNIEELTAFTEKATALIYEAKQSGIDIITMEAPPEICELTKDNNETANKDRRIYNTFLFDLCKETISEVYRSEYEKPGPSWTKPNVKTKPTMKIPNDIDELNEYVNKEVATLFGFKTKLQRENMVMRWSRKRRDRVDELLAREAQAEEEEWTKFHHDELAVKNSLTVAILDTLILETANIIKVAYAKKRKVTV